MTAPRNATYQRPADVQPAYYRTGDGSSGPTMESGADYKSTGSFCHPYHHVVIS